LFLCCLFRVIVVPVQCNTNRVVRGSKAGCGSARRRDDRSVNDRAARREINERRAARRRAAPRGGGEMSGYAVACSVHTSLQWHRVSQLTVTVQWTPVPPSPHTAAQTRAHPVNQSSSIRIMRIIFLESYARILTYETLSYVNHIVAKNTRSTLL